MTLTVGSLFSGIGGFDRGFDRAGCRVIWQVEQDVSCQSILRRHWPGVGRYGDITTIDTASLAVPDILVGGFPCQDLSVAGRGAGLAGERSGLFHEFMRVAAALRPTWLVIENVPGLRTNREGRDMATVLWTLGQLGYWWAYRSLDAQFFNVAQRRERVFIIGHSGSRTRPAEVLFEPESGSWHTPPRREAGQGATRSFALGSHAGSNGVASNSSHEQGGPVGMGIVEEATPALRSGRTQAIAGPAWPAEVAPTLGTGWADRHPELPDVAPALRSGGPGAARVGDSRGQDCVIPVLAGSFQNTGQGWWNASDVATTIRTPEGSGSLEANVVAFDMQQVTSVANRQRMAPGRPAPTLHQGGGAYAFTERTRADGRNVETQEEVAYSLNNPGDGGRTQENRVLTPTMAVRRLTPVECSRLQNFPDDWNAWGVDEAGKRMEMSDSQRYRQLGNAVVVSVAEWLARRLVAAHGP